MWKIIVSRRWTRNTIKEKQWKGKCTTRNCWYCTECCRWRFGDWPGCRSTHRRQCRRQLSDDQVGPGAHDWAVYTRNRWRPQASKTRTASAEEHGGPRYRAGSALYSIWQGVFCLRAALVRLNVTDQVVFVVYLHVSIFIAGFSFNSSFVVYVDLRRFIVAVYHKTSAAW